MKSSTLQQLLLYKYRYILGAVLAFGLLGSLLSIELGRVPSGLHPTEIKSVIASGAVGMTWSNDVIDLPYHALQAVSIKLLGLNDLAIKLPSMVLGFIAGSGLFILLRRWFRTNVASIAAFFAVTNSIFLIAGRTGDPSIMPILWSVLLLLFATLITQNVRGQFIWRVGLGVVAGFALYTPLSAYVIIAALIAGVLHPHVRYVLRRYGSTETLTASLLFAVIVAPLAYGLYQDPRLAFNLLGVPSSLPAIESYGNNLVAIAARLGAFWLPTISDVIQPVFSVATLALMIIGLYRIIAEHHATRTYALLFWLAIIVPVAALQPDANSVLFVPAALLIAVGLGVLIRYWYRLFPRNPYARLVGLLPLIGLVGGIAMFNYSTYFDGLRYSTTTATIYRNDLRLLNEGIASDTINDSRVTIVVPADKVAFYDDLARPAADNCSASICVRTYDPTVNDLISQKGSVFIHHAVAAPVGRQPNDILVRDTKESPLSWRVYTQW